MKRSLVAVLSALVIVTLSIGPASAHPIPHVAAAAFVGTAGLTGTGDLYAPVSSTLVTGAPAGTQCDTSATVRVGVCPTPAPGTVSWNFSIGFSGVNGTGGHYQPPSRFQVNDPAPFVQVGANNIFTGTGGVAGGTVNSGPAGAATVGPYCGASSGSGGSGTININTTASVQPGPVVNGVPTNTIGVASVGWIQSAATVIVYDGDVVTDDAAAVTGGITGVVSAIPPNSVTGGGSCLDGSAATFIIVGTALAVWYT